MQHENLKKGVLFGAVGNILFVVFAFVCLIYYLTYHSGSAFSKILEVTAYLVELSGFGLLIYADYLLIISVRFRRTMKVCFTGYIILEALMMVLELNAAKISFYAPYSLPLAIVHSIISGAACFAFLQLDPENKRFEFLIIGSVGIVLAGMLGNIMGIRVYFSIALNALGQVLLFIGINRLMERQLIEIDCYGDRASVSEFKSSTLFSDPLAGRDESKTEIVSEETSADEEEDFSS